MRTRNSGVGFIGLGSAVPPRVETNEQVTRHPGVRKTAQQIYDITGIVTRHIGHESMRTSDIAYEACMLALEDARLSPADIGGIIVGTNTPDYQVPSLAAVLHGRIKGLPHSCSTVDFRTGCAGFCAATEFGVQMVSSGRANNVLVIGADKLWDITSPKTSLAMLAGDGAGAGVLSHVPDEFGFKAFVSSTDGSYVDALKIPAGGTAEPFNNISIALGRDKLIMDGKGVYKLGVAAIKQCIMELAELIDKDISQIHHVVCHMANWKMIAQAFKDLGMDEDQFPNGIRGYGNCSTASIPLTLDMHTRNGRIKRNDIVLQIGYGAGFSVYANACIWNHNRRAA